MGPAAKNRLPKTNRDGDLQIGTTSLPLPAGTLNLQDGSSVDLGLNLEEFGMESGPDTAPVPTTVDLIGPTGPDVHASLNPEVHFSMARLSARAALIAGKKTRFHIDMLKLFS